MSLAPARERLRQRMALLQVEAKKSLGQNFLVSDVVIQKILRAAHDQKPATIVEVGPGLGALTDGLAQLGSTLTLVELDRVLAQYWRENGFAVIETDALQWDWNLGTATAPVILVSNLPYQISSSLVIDRCLDDRPLDAMILMFQKEVAQRLRASVDHESYGFLSAVAQTFWKIEFLLEASSHDFQPPPKVASRVLVFRPLASPVSDRRAYFRFLKACFVHPRKILVSNLAEAWNRPKAESQALLEQNGWDPRIRADQLSPQKLLELYRLFGG